MSTAAQFQPSGNEVKAAAFGDHRRHGGMAKTRARVLRHLVHSGPATRNQIADAENLPLSSICGRCRELLGQGYIDVAGTTADRPARQMLELSADGADAVAQMMKTEGAEHE